MKGTTVFPINSNWPEITNKLHCSRAEFLQMICYATNENKILFNLLQDAEKINDNKLFQNAIELAFTYYLLVKDNKNTRNDY